MYPGGVLKTYVGLTREAYVAGPPFSGIDHAVVSLMGKSLPAILQLRVVKELALRTFPVHFPFTANKMTPGEFEEFHGRGEPRHPAAAFLALAGARGYSVTGLHISGVIAACTFREQLTPSLKWICGLGLRRLIPPFWFALDRRDSPWWSAKIEPVVRPHRRHLKHLGSGSFGSVLSCRSVAPPCPPSLPRPCGSMSALFRGRAMPSGVFRKAILSSSASLLHLSSVPSECFTFANLVS